MSGLRPLARTVSQPAFRASSPSPFWRNFKALKPAEVRGLSVDTLRRELPHFPQLSGREKRQIPFDNVREGCETAWPKRSWAGMGERDVLQFLTSERRRMEFPALARQPHIEPRRGAQPLIAATRMEAATLPLRSVSLVSAAGHDLERTNRTEADAVHAMIAELEGGDFTSCQILHGGGLRPAHVERAADAGITGPLHRKSRGKYRLLFGYKGPEMIVVGFGLAKNIYARTN